VADPVVVVVVEPETTAPVSRLIPPHASLKYDPKLKTSFQHPPSGAVAFRVHPDEQSEDEQNSRVTVFPEHPNLAREANSVSILEIIANCLSLLKVGTG